MKGSALLAVLPMFLVSPVMAQGMDNMPGMQMPSGEDVSQPVIKKAKHHKTHSGTKNSDTPAGAHKKGPEKTSGPSSNGAANDKSNGDMVGMDHDQMGGMEDVGSEPPPHPPTDYAADRFYDPDVMNSARAELRKEHGGELISNIMLNLGEYQLRNGEDGYRWDGEARVGGDIDRLVLKSEGEGGVSSGIDTAEIQALYSRAISPYFDLQGGLRQDFKPTPMRTYATVGFEGLAPYWFDTEGALFLSNHAEILGRLQGTYDLQLTQRWILQPRAEINVAAQNVPEIGIGSGVSNIELGLRLRYEVRREFAPYVGISFDRKLGNTAHLARLRGDDTQQTSIVFGIRTWF